jgi:hypothetical protein
MADDMSVIVVDVLPEDGVGFPVSALRAGASAPVRGPRRGSALLAVAERGPWGMRARARVCVRTPWLPLRRAAGPQPTASLPRTLPNPRPPRPRARQQAAAPAPKPSSGGGLFACFKPPPSPRAAAAPPPAPRGAALLADVDCLEAYPMDTHSLTRASFDASATPPAGARPAPDFTVHGARVRGRLGGLGGGGGGPERGPPAPPPLARAPRLPPSRFPSPDPMPPPRPAHPAPPQAHLFSPDESWHGSTAAGGSIHGSIGGSLHGAASLGGSLHGGPGAGMGGGSAHGGGYGGGGAPAAAAPLPGVTASGGSGHGGTGVRGESAHGGSMFGGGRLRAAPPVGPAAAAEEPPPPPPSGLARVLTVHSPEERAARAALNAAAPEPPSAVLPAAAPLPLPRPHSFHARADVAAAEAAAAEGPSPLPPPPGAMFPAPGEAVPRIERVSGSAPFRLLSEVAAADTSPSSAGVPSSGSGSGALRPRGSGESEPAREALATAMSDTPLRDLLHIPRGAQR